MESNKKQQIIDLFIANYAQAFDLALSLKKSFKKVENIFPVSIQDLKNLSDENKDNIDLVIYRFGKVQDILGDKIFRGIISLDLEKTGPMRDIINKIEQKNILDNTDYWFDLREARNDITHEYRPAGEKAAETLNEIVESIPYLLQVISKVHKYAQKEIKIDMSEFNIDKLIKD